MIKNPINDFLSKVSYHRQVELANDRFAFKPFAVRFRKLKLYAIIGRLLLPVISIATGMTFMSSLLHGIVPHTLAAVFSGGLLLALMEGMKADTLKIGFEGLYGGRKWVATLLLAGVLMSGLSIYVSVNGAKELYYLMDDKEAMVTNTYQQEMDSVRTHYVAATQEIESKIEEINQRQYQRPNQFLYASERKAILNYQEQLLGVAAEKATAEQELKASFKEQKGEIIADTSFNAFRFAVLAGLIDLLIILSNWFLVYFDYQVVMENDALRKIEATEKRHKLSEYTTRYELPKQSLLRQKTENIPQPTKEEEEAPRVIGFQQNFERKTAQAVSAVKVNEESKNSVHYIHSKGYKIECKHCGETAIKKVPMAKFCSDRCRREHHKSK
ncbi:hypothetical protein [Algivirga pacifica]|uniref:Uncharacterized protein n=1 Tax=Algivirga pacifica TaxID=1162670 RepID=A0ABP9D4C0_9BACT